MTERGIKLAAKRKDNSMKDAVEKILKKKGIDYGKWKDDVINQRKVEVVSNQDKEWIERTIQEASMDLIMEEIIKEPKNHNQDSSSVKSFERQI